MRYQFSITDEKTLENDTVKVVVQINGPANEPRARLEQRVRIATAALLPKADWAYSGLSIATNDYPMFSITASTRIAAADNDDLYRRAANYSLENPEAGANIKVIQTDTSMPLFKTREGLREIRQSIYKQALEELQILQSNYVGSGSLRIKSIDFIPSFDANALSNVRGTSSSYASNAGGAAIGSFEKLYLSATVTIIDGEDEPQAAIVQE